MLYTAMQASPLRFGPFVQYDLELGGEPAAPGPFHLGYGLRVLGPLGGGSVPLETYVQAEVVGSIGPWVPAIGPELGLTGMFRPEPRVGASTVLAEEHDLDWGWLEQRDDPGPLYFAMNASVLRFSEGRFRISALDVQVGTSLSRPGSALRFQLNLAEGTWLP